MAKIKYFNGTDELLAVTCVPIAQFIVIGGIKSKANYVDSFKRLAGRSIDGRLLPVERKIEYKSNPSKHICNAKCLNGSINGACECQCGGKNHGAGMLSSLLAAA